MAKTTSEATDETVAEVLTTYYCPKTGVSYECNEEIAKSLVTEVVKKDGNWGVKESNKYVTKEGFKKLMESNPYLKPFHDTEVRKLSTEVEEKDF